MSDILKDKRFSHVVSNPRFKSIPRKERKVKIDKRFQSMFTDKRFQVKYTVDERGRKINELQSENYKRYYDLTDESSDSDEEKDNEDLHSADIKSSSPKKSENEMIAHERNTGDEPNQDLIDETENEANDEFEGELLKKTLSSDQNKNEISDDTSESASSKPKVKDKLIEAHKEVNKFVDEIHKSRLNEKVRGKLTDITIDYARGIGTLLSGSESSSEESSSEESDVETVEHPWGELDKDAETTEEIHRRLAVCNMDWDRVTAKDLMVLFHSFLPAHGIIESVTIYPSEFGLARMAEEELKGPKELVECKKDNIIESDEEEIEEGSSYQREKLREYQLKRLKYYYAVIVCNTDEVANTLYTECDGLEYESSATKLDLRFIPDDVTFDQKPHDVCTTLPDLKKYKPRLFINTALQQGKVDLTWDETDPNRVDFTRKVLAGEEVDENEVKAYLASSSEDEEEASEKPDLEKSDEDDDNLANDENRIMKYRALISNLQDSNDKNKGDVEMEVTWGPDSSSRDRTILDKESESEDSASEEDLNSQDDEKTMKKINKKNLKSVIKEDFKNSNSEEEKDNAELELLLADDDPDESSHKHFSLKAIQKSEKENNKKKKWRKKKKNDYKEEDTFKIDASDSRFSALFTSHHFNIDPADPHFRKTKAMNELIAEKQKRRKMEA